MKIGFVIVAVLAVLATTVLVTAQDTGETLFLAPGNAAASERTLVTSGMGFGLVPMTVNMSYTAGLGVDFDQAVAPARALVRASGLPSAYDLRSLGRVSPVRDQGSAGTCWAFATYGSLESVMYRGVWDFSENNMKNTAGFDMADGGNPLMASAYLTRWSGPVNESDDPYDPYGAVSPALPPVRHVQDILFVPDRANATDNDNIKRAVQTYGGIFTTLYYLSTGYNPATWSYYCSATTNANHAVVIVGWDDAYSRANFATEPPGDGAFIVKNSWGSSFGDGGYFYISYYDTSVGLGNVIFTSESAARYAHIYQHDPLGWVSSVGYGTPDRVAWMAANYTAHSDELLSAVGFYATDVNTAYSLSVLRNNVTVASAVGTISVPGYRTVEINTMLSAGDQFQVRVRLHTPNTDYPVPIEYQEIGYSSRATANASESYVSHDGVTWTDITTVYSNTDVCLKAYTDDVFNISLVSGWNLISPPFTCNVSTLPAGVVSVWGWDEATQNWQYYSNTDAYFYRYYPAITELMGGHAYWVEMNRSGTLALRGAVETATLVDGWNFVGTGLAAVPASALCAGDSVWGWDETVQNWQYYSNTDAYFYRYYPAIATAEPGHGYWVEV